MVEFLIITLLVTWSAIVVFKKVFPKTAMRFFLNLSQRCSAQGWHALAKWLEPKGVAGCGGSCGCEADPKDADPKANVHKNVEIQAVKWK